MGAFHQVGHDSENLIFDQGLAGFSGAILSPVNYSPSDTKVQVVRASKEQHQFEKWFDPQLYVPWSTRGELPKWDHFPKDIESADVSRPAWWSSTVDSLIGVCEQLQPTAVCSPVTKPQVFPNSYYSLSVDTGNLLVNNLNGSGIKVQQTLIISPNDLLQENRSMQIASIVTRTKAAGVYMLIYDDTPPRREIAQGLQIEKVMQIISTLKEAGIPVTVGYCASDMILWKAAGAESVATGKFFNLRRFTTSRFEEPTTGRGAATYWFEEGLMAFLREADLDRVTRANLLSKCSAENPFGKEIINQKRSEPGKAWTALSWRQFLWWFCNCEARINSGLIAPSDLLVEAEGKWAEVQRAGILFEEPQNDGAWIRIWRAALASFQAQKGR
jgi:hypothetical protein